MRGKEIAEQINILGDDGVPVEYHVIFWKSEVIDYVILQQDAFDEVDAVTPMERQEVHPESRWWTFVVPSTSSTVSLKSWIISRRLINLCKQMNYAEFKSEKFEDYKRQIREMVAERQ